MASSALFLLLFITLSSSTLLQIHAARPFKKIKEESQPEFVHEDQHGYGLYGRQTSINDDDKAAESKIQRQEAGSSGRKGMSDTRYLANGVFFYDLKNEKKQKANVNAYGVNNAERTGSSVERHGMSDTRFLENGKYFYDVKNEQKKNDNMAEAYERSLQNRYGP